jgi:hypothetical protein
MTEQAELWLDRDTEFDDDETNETSSDLKLDEAQFANLLVAPADWTIETLYAQIGKQIDLDPDFQRRNVWSSPAKSRFIESLFLGIPIPQILLSARPGKKNSFLVLDGKQRLIAIKEFIDGKLPSGRTFRLKDLRVLTELEGKSWNDIKPDADLSSKLLNETQRTTVLRGWQDEAVLYEIFFRLNSGSVKLSPMELRMSLYPGDFLKFIVRWTEDIGPVHHLLKKRSPDPRMGDVELAVRFLAFTDPDIQYSGDLKRFLDTCCKEYNQKYDDPAFRTSVEGRLSSMNAGIELGISVFGIDKFCRKFQNGRYETRFNRAIFDVLGNSLATAQLRDWCLQNPEKLRAAFEDLSTNDPAFIRAVEVTTKSLDATRTRFTKWYDAVKQLTGIQLEFPNIAA